jgi:hypothetical protein
LPDLRPIGAVTIPRGSGLALVFGAVWVLSLGNGIHGFVTKVDPRTNRVAGRPIRISPPR